ncbi:phosphoglycerate mutase-like protein [Fistulina hepatica ATCC 64428]|uniref:Phosphoglycerate mutase-like protein n=1 Tax=Fistulina hepatica ATCC 64428 TaxID=1128425 RepID=A0A0D7AID1_9AGAR|nr:phosphoglycerate mutase-like protein [Fistulina hepatica ATCC 64428]
MAPIIYILRHGFRLNWVTQKWESPTGLERDPPLAAFGLTQSQEVADYFLSLPEDERPTLIFSSPYYRCLQTVQPTARALCRPIFVEHALSEWYSPVTPGTGLHPRASPAADLKKYVPEIDAEAWSTIWYPSRKGEDVDDVHDRVAGFLEIFIPELEHRFPNHERILLVSHAATIAALAGELLGSRDLHIRVGTCTLIEAVPRAGAAAVGKVTGKWTTPKLAAGELENVDTDLAEGSHLSGGSQRDWGLDDVVIQDGKVISDSGIPGTENEADEPVGPQVCSRAPRTSNL